jgi:hypothetical protein
MLKVKRVLGLAGILVLVLAMLFGCARLFWNGDAQSGWYIRLNIGSPGAKAIGVGEYDVTGLSIAVYDPGDQLLDAIEWDAVEGPKSYTVQVSQAGTHRIEVTHISDDGGEVVEATESADFEIETMVITVIDVTPGMVGLIRVEGEPVGPVDLTGFWDAYLTPTGGETNPPHLLYIKQTGTSLNSIEITGTVDGLTVTMVMDDDSATFIGTIEPDGTFGGSFDWMGETGTFEMVRSNLLFGPFELSGVVNLSTDLGLCWPGEEEIVYPLVFDVRAGTLQGFLKFENYTGLSTGTYSVLPREGSDDPGPTEVIGTFFEGSGGDSEDYQVEAGTLDLTRYDATGVSGTFTLGFEEGKNLSGFFELNQPMYSNGTVTITGGWWNDAPVPAETTSGLMWSTEIEHKWGEWSVSYLDEDRDVSLTLMPWNGPMAAGTYSVPTEMWVQVADQNEDEAENQYEGEAQSGTVVITSFQNDVGMAGYFEDLIFPEGTLSGSFDVSFLTTEYE